MLVLCTLESWGTDLLPVSLLLLSYGRVFDRAAGLLSTPYQLVFGYLGLESLRSHVAKQQLSPFTSYYYRDKAASSRNDM